MTGGGPADPGRPAPTPGARLPALGPRGEGWVVGQGVLLLLVAAAGLTGPAWDGPARVATTVAGVGLIVGGLGLALGGMRDLGSALTPLPRPVAGTRLVAHGAYRLVRHPIYGGLVLGGFGWGLCTAAPLALGAAAALLGYFALKARREEAWLAEAVPGYVAYAARTRMIIPFVI